MPEHVVISAADADTIKRFIEENLRRFIDWCETNNEFEGDAEERAAELLDSLEA